MAQKKVLEKDKKYYWLKLKNDFFKRHDIRIIEGMPNGKDYVLFYLKLLVESVGHEGELRFSDTIPYNEEMLSTITNTNIDIVRTAVKLFRELDMMEVLEDGTIFMQEVNKMIGHESYWADQKRKQRSETPLPSLNIGQCPTNVQCVQPMSKQEIDIEIDIDKEIDIAANARAREEEAHADGKHAAAAAKQNDLKELVRAFENEICKISPIVAQDLEERYKQIGKDLLLECISEAGRNKGGSWKYVDKIAQRCVDTNIKTVEEFNDRKKAHQEKQQKQQPTYWSEEQDRKKKKKNYDDIMMN